MNIPVVLAVVAAFVLLHSAGPPARLGGRLVGGCYVLFRFGFAAPIPASVVSMYMAIVSIAILAYVSSSQERREEVSRPLIRLMTDRRYAVLLGATFSRSRRSRPRTSTCG
jgi:hypothetical protein